MGPERYSAARILLVLFVFMPGCFSLSLWDTGVRHQEVSEIQFWRAGSDLVLVYELRLTGGATPGEAEPHWASASLELLYASNERATFVDHRGLVPPELFARMEPIPPIGDGAGDLRLTGVGCLGYRAPEQGDLYLLRDNCSGREARFRLPAQNQNTREAWAYPILAVGAPVACVLDIVTSPVQICLFGYVLGKTSAVFGKGADGTE